jgi:hypothetical protein
MQRWAVLGLVCVCWLVGEGLWAISRPTISQATISQATVWKWRYAGPGVWGAGRLETAAWSGGRAGDRGGATDSVEIIAISGVRNGVAIVALQPRGTAIPGNEPYRVDNRLFRRAPWLTGDGVGFRLADGSYANVFFQTHTAPHDTREYFSRAPFVDGTLGPEDAETRLEWQIEPVRSSGLAWGLGGLLTALGGGLMLRWRGRRRELAGG